MSKVDFDASAGDLLGTDIGPYRLVRRLGMGGMAETFVAIRRGPSGFTQRVCLKLVLPFFREDEEFVKLFQREARLAAKLRHSNIVGVIDFGEINGRSYMALELVDGVDLQVLLDAQSGQKLSPEYVALIGHDLASALHHAHNPPREAEIDGGAIIHRDISPSNVLISGHGEIMLSDFGVAKAVTGRSHKQSAVKGKIPYMSPEQLRLEPLDGRADLFGVGVVLYEALCGRRPYEGGHDPATIMQILQGERQPLARLAPGAPPELCALIDRLIEPDRDARPDNAAELIELLDPFVPSPRTRRELGRRVDGLRPKDDVPVEGYAQPSGDDDTALQDEAAGESEQPSSGIVEAARRQGRAEPWAEGGTVDSLPPAPPKRRSPAAGVVVALLVVAGLVAGVFALRPSEAEEVPNAEQPPARADAVAQEEPAGRPVQEEPPQEEPVTPADPAEARTEPVDAQDPPTKVVEKPDGAPATDATPPPKRKRAPPPAASLPASLTVVVYPWGDVWIDGERRGSAPLKNLALKPGRYTIGAGQGKPTVTQTIRLRSGEKKKLKLDVTR